MFEFTFITSISFRKFQKLDAHEFLAVCQVNVIAIGKTTLIVTTLLHLTVYNKDSRMLLLFKVSLYNSFIPNGKVN